MATPYDGKVAVWHWKGDSVAEATVQDIADTLKTWAPNVKQVWVKTSDGEYWQGRFDTDRNLAIDNAASVAKWVRVLEQNGLEFHAWAVVKGQNVQEEAQRIIDVCNVPGVRSMVLDVEPYQGFWTVGREPIRPLMVEIRRKIGGRFHIGMAVDPRPQHYRSIFPDEWRPFVNSVHLQLYWETFQRPWREVLDEGFNTWKDYGLPVFAVLPGSAPRDEIILGRQYVVSEHGADGISWWRFGIIGPVEFPAINAPIEPGDNGGTDPPPPSQGRYGIAVVVHPDKPQYNDGAHGSGNPNNTFKTFQGTWGWTVKYKDTVQNSSTVWARWDPQLVASGWYEVSVFVPARHATTRNARYKLHGVLGTASELTISVDQSRFYNVWVPLGVYQFDANNFKAGLVFLNDLTNETGREIAFDAIRWRQIVGIVPTEKYLADGYDSPVGTINERRSDKTWPGNWFDATGFNRLYNLGAGQAYHTGADLNLNEPYWDADAHSPVYSVASGLVTFADRLPGWGNVVVIRHDPLVSTGKVIYSRSTHVNDIRVQVGQRVVRGEQIAKVGDAEGRFAYHLHFDLSPTSILESQPFHWPGLDRTGVITHYVDPQAFIRNHRPVDR